MPTIPNSERLISKTKLSAKRFRSYPMQIEKLVSTIIRLQFLANRLKDSMLYLSLRLNKLIILRQNAEIMIMS